MEHTAEEILKDAIGGFDPFIHSQFIKAMKIYANYKLEGASESASLIGNYWGNDCNKCLFFDTDNGIRITVDKQSILSLKDII